jgi:hypothetical protein
MNKKNARGLERLAQQQQNKQRQAGGKPGGNPRGKIQVLPSPRQPRAVARVFVAEMATHASGALILRHWRGGWWSWRATHWQEAEPRAVRELVYRFTENALYIDDKGLPAPWQPNRYKIDDVLDAAAALCLLPNHVDQPSWLDGRDSGVIVACHNGLLDVERRVLLEHTPQFFNLVAVPFDYDHGARVPRCWRGFLRSCGPAMQRAARHSPPGLATYSAVISSTTRSCCWSARPAPARD